MKKIAFLFTGQGAQFPGMAKTFHDRFDIARQTFEEASDTLGFDLAKLCFEGGLAKLTKTQNIQPAIFTASVAAYRVYMQEIGIRPEYCAGPGLGEYSALVCSGVLRFKDAVRLLGKRGRLSAEVIARDIGTMTIVEDVSKELIEEECRRASNETCFAAVNCYNSPIHFSIAGHQAAVRQVEAALLETDAKVTPLSQSAPIFSPLMESIAGELQSELEGCKFGQFRWPVISNVTSLPYRSPSQITGLLRRQIVEPVRWQETMKFLYQNGVTIVIEMGPKNVLANLVKLNTPAIEAFCYEKVEDRQSLIDMFTEAAPAALSKKPDDLLISRCLAAAISTQNNNQDRQEYLNGVINPYLEIKKLQEELKRQGAAPTIQQMKQALLLLATIFKTKKVPVGEQEEWFYRILDETGTGYVLRDEIKIG